MLYLGCKMANTDKDKIRMTFWLPTAQYLAMESVTAPREEDHAAFIRRAIETQVKLDSMPPTVLKVVLGTSTPPLPTT